LQVLFDGARCLESLTFSQLLADGATGQFGHSHQLGLLGGAQPLEGLQLPAGGVEQTRHTAGGQQFFGQCKHVLASHAGAQQDGQQFHIAERLGAAFE